MSIWSEGHVFINVWLYTDLHLMTKYSVLLYLQVTTKMKDLDLKCPDMWFVNQMFECELLLGQGSDVTYQVTIENGQQMTLHPSGK